ncbi:hypothetical protein B0H14DRAFT_2580202 [Mycena olivaceomarginata]|nr:hypothetical protein B0H14DRAFT_2580202 [Mycena olivaceomarginata]
MRDTGRRCLESGRDGVENDIFGRIQRSESDSERGGAWANPAERLKAWWMGPMGGGGVWCSDALGRLGGSARREEARRADPAERLKGGAGATVGTGRDRVGNVGLWCLWGRVPQSDEARVGRTQQSEVRE